MKKIDKYNIYCEYAKFDFRKFEVSWLLNLYPYALERIARDKIVKENVRVAIASALAGKEIEAFDSQRLNDILVKYFC